MADEEDYICITDMAAAKSDNSRAADVIRNWLRNRSTLEFLSTWEEMYNPNFKVFESEHFKKDVGSVIVIQHWRTLMEIEALFNTVWLDCFFKETAIKRYTAYLNYYVSLEECFRCSA